MTHRDASPFSVKHYSANILPFYRQSTLLSTKNLVDKTKTELHDLVQVSRRQEMSLKLQVEKLRNSFKDAVQVFSGLQNVRVLSAHSTITRKLLQPYSYYRFCSSN